MGGALFKAKIMRLRLPAQFSILAAIPTLAAGSLLPAMSQSTPEAAPPTTNVTVTVNVLANRHPISPYIYGASFPPSTAYIKTGGVTLSRWGGNNSSRYNWKLNAKNDDADWYFENYSWGSPDSAAYISQAVAGGAAPIMTIPMLEWVAKDTTSSSFSVKKYGAQCAADPYNSDAGDGILPGTNCLYGSDYLTGNNPTDADTHLLDSPSAGDPPNSVYRNQWIEAIAPLYGKQPHLYQLDNEPEIWSGTHRDVHPAPTGYDELATDIVHAGHKIKAFDPAAVRLAPVFDSWWFYWNGANSNDKGDHGGLDFLPWLLNEIWYKDQTEGSRSFDIFDVHAYFNGPDTSGMTTAQVRAAALRETRDWWDPSYISESGTVNQPWATFTQPDKTVAFVIPRMRAMANSIYPGTPISFTEWNGALAGESDFSTALVDADAYGILGKERVWGASRWVASDPTAPAYKALELYRTAGGSSSFGPISVSAVDSASPNLFSAYASIDPAGEGLRLMIVNKDPVNQAAVTFKLDDFDPSTMTTFTLSQAKPTSIVASKSREWSATQTFAPYSATLVAVNGRTTHTIASEWDLNPDTLLASTSGEITIHPTITGGNGPVTLTEATGSGGMKLTIAGKVMNSLANGEINIKTPAAPGLYSFTVTGRDSDGTIQTQQGWVLATVPASTLTKTGDKQTAKPGAKIALTATYVPRASGSTGATAAGVDLLFTASAGTLSERVVRTQANGEATVELTLPSKPGRVTVTAIGPVFWGTPTATFTETVQ
jgi:hypothetical protein